MDVDGLITRFVSFPKMNTTNRFASLDEGDGDSDVFLDSNDVDEVQIADKSSPPWTPVSYHKIADKVFPASEQQPKQELKPRKSKNCRYDLSYFNCITRRLEPLNAREEGFSGVYAYHVPAFEDDGKCALVEGTIPTTTPLSLYRNLMTAVMDQKLDDKRSLILALYGKLSPGTLEIQLFCHRGNYLTSEAVVVLASNLKRIICLSLAPKIPKFNLVVNLTPKVIEI